MNLQDRISYILETAAQKMAEIDFREEPFPLARDTVLLGEGACVDSMGFVNFIVAVEDAVESELRISLNLSEELASSSAGKHLTLRISDLTAVLSDLIQRRDGG
jgi:hypothetical protein